MQKKEKNFIATAGAILYQSQQQNVFNFFRQLLTAQCSLVENSLVSSRCGCCNQQVHVVPIKFYKIE